MLRLDLSYQIQLLTPMHVGTGMGFAMMADDLIVRAGPAKGNGTRFPCIPGSAIKGRIRSRCEALAAGLRLRQCASRSTHLQIGRGERRCKRRLCVICRLFGSRYVPGPLCFSDALLIQEWQRVGTHLTRAPAGESGGSDLFALAVVRTGNKVERAMHTVEPEFLFSLEHTTDELQFAGSIIGHVDPQPVKGLELALPLEGWLLAVGLKTLDKIGGIRSRGLGRCRITVASLKVDGNDLTTSLDSLLAHEDYLLGVPEYEA